MRKALFIVVLVVVGACCPCHQAGVATAVADSDSVYTSHVDIVRLTIRDTILLQPLAQYHDRVQLEATSSFLENDYCTSAASVDEDGMLSHTLDTRDSATLPARVVYRDRVVRDTVIRLKDRIDVRTETVVREIRRATWWQRTQIIMLWVLLGALAIVYRREILSLLKRIIPWI